MIRSRRATTRVAVHESGFTLLEAILVVVLLGLLAATALPSLDDLSPKYRLRSAARAVGSTINWAHSLSASTRERHGLYYNLEDGYFEIIQPPGEEDDPDQRIEDRPRLAPTFLPDFVKIERILLPDGGGESGGEVFIEFDIYGNEGSHIVWLKNEDEDSILAVSFNALLGVVDYHAEEIEFPEF